jgi:hypothetical protein
VGFWHYCVDWIFVADEEKLPAENV